MSLHTTVRYTDGVATITLVGELDPTAVPRLASLVESTGAAEVHQLVLNAGRLTRLSSAAVRYLADAHQKLGRNVRLVVTGARQEVAETIKLAGLDRSVTVLRQ